MRRSHAIALAATAILGLCLIAGGTIYNIPAVNDRLYPRIDRFMSGLRERFNPAPDVVPTAVPMASLPTFVPETPTPAPPTSTRTPLADPNDATASAAALSPAPPTAAAIPVVYDLPASVSLPGSRYEPQLYNNCGPATLTAALVYWGWRGSETDSLTWYGNGVDIRWQRDIADVIKPNKVDKNVMPYELANYAEERAGLRSLIRYGGDVDLIRRFVANGIPVIIERGFREDEHGQVGQGWEGHYSVVTGYNDSTRQLLTQDSFKGPNYLKDYDLITRDWRDFNYIYIILYPAEREAQVMTLLGDDANVTANLNRALSKAQAEAARHSEPFDLSFAWFNIGTSLQLLGRNQDAALAFDQSRSYESLPYRMLWYQTFMYKAYFYSERYQDVIALADVTLQTPGLEESYYWRGWAYYQLGDSNSAVSDMRAALAGHPQWDQALAVFAQWGVTP
jgi:tetratricopeptide (TPR) repeat protein